jgi:HEAT repeat protein
MRRVLLSLLLASLLPACGGRNKQAISLYEAGDYTGAARVADEGLASHPGDDGLWQMRIRAALALGDADGVAKAYAGYQSHRDDDDKDLLGDLAIATLGQALASPSAKMKIIAIEAVESAEIHELTDPVGERMGDDDDRVAAAAAVAVLRGFPQARGVVKQMLQSEEADARRIAIDGIARKFGELARIDLTKFAASDPDPRVRQTAIRWLGRLKDPEATELLVRQLRHTDEGVRAAAVLALAQIGKGDLAKLGEQAMKDRALPVRLAGIELLVAAKRTDALIALAEDPNPLVAAEAALAAKRTDLAAKALERAATAENWTFRSGALNIARRALGEEAAAFAKKLAADPDPRVRVAAARVIANAGDKAAAIAILVEALSGEAALTAATDLADLGDPRGIAALTAAIRDQKRTPTERSRAVFAHRSAHQVTPGLVSALADTDGVVRVEAAAAIVAMVK